MTTPHRILSRTTIALAALVVLAVPGTAAVADSAIPYQDPGKAGSITLCDVHGDPVTHGDVSASPFVWSLHSDLAATGGFAAAGRTATYLAYQPRQDEAPGDWSGRVMSPASRYTDPQHPTVQLTPVDDGLDQMTSDFPPLWDHLIQLRMYLAAPGLSATGTRYAALTLQISADGRTWTALDPGHTPCDVGRAVSVATLLGVAPTGTAKPTPTPLPSVPLATGTAKVHPGVVTDPTGPTLAAATTSSGGGGWRIGAVIAGLLAAAGAGSVVTRWRARRSAP
jgi:hypothetical protein